MRYLNGFIVIGVMLMLISVAGAMTHNKLLTEPGQSPNPYAWLLYLGAGALMIVNGVVSAKLYYRPVPPAREPISEESNAEEPVSESAQND